MSILLSAQDKPNAFVARGILGCEYTIKELEMATPSAFAPRFQFATLTKLNDMFPRVDMHDAKYIVIERTTLYFLPTEAVGSGADYALTRATVTGEFAAAFCDDKGRACISTMICVKSASGAKTFIVRSTACRVIVGGKPSAFDNAWNSFLIPEGDTRFFAEMPAEDYAQKSAPWMAYSFVLKTIQNHEKTGKWLESD